MARQWLAAGADLIIGGHPHVVQDAQIIDGKLVLYSLGNFVFDQTFSEETQRGLIITGELTAENLKIVLVPIRSLNLKPEILSGADKQQLIDRVCANLEDYCQNGIINLPRK